MSVQEDEIGDINPTTWFGSRELQCSPRHFVKSSIPITSTSKKWIGDKLVGRYFLYINFDPISNAGFVENFAMFPAFEDPAEAMLYELTWG